MSCCSLLFCILYNSVYIVCATLSGILCEFPHLPSCPEHPSGGQVAGHPGEEAGAARREQPPRAPRLHQRRVARHPRRAHHPTGHPGELHQDHQRAAHGHARQPAQSSRQLQPGMSVCGGMTSRYIILMLYATTFAQTSFVESNSYFSGALTQALSAYKHLKCSHVIFIAYAINMLLSCECAIKLCRKFKPAELAVDLW